MSSSVSKQSTIFLTDYNSTIKYKVMKYSFIDGWGDDSLKDHRLYGGNIEKDIPCLYLKFFEMDDEKLNNIYKGFKEGKIACGEVKKILVDKLAYIITEHQKKKSNKRN